MTTGSVGQGSHFIIKNCINNYVSRGGIGMGFFGNPQSRALGMGIFHFGLDKKISGDGDFYPRELGIY